MVGGGKKWKQFKENNASNLRNLLSQSEGDATYMQDMLNQATDRKCEKQIKKWIKENKKAGVLK